MPFIDILYALAIGTGFMSFPNNPEKNILGTTLFIYTLFITAHDWYEYHDKVKVIPEKRYLMYFIIQIFVILVLNQMFRHSVVYSLISWLAYSGVFCLLNTLWNIITPFERHYLYATTSAFLSVVAFLMAGFYQTVVNFIPTIDGRWTIVVFSILIPFVTSLVENWIDKRRI
jgi:uncharacterized membrane protein YvlD (DUF360 family)